MSLDLGKILENQLLDRWGFPRHPAQLNGLHEADAEILPLENDEFLAVTIDTLSEEIRAGLYQEPETIGWVAVAASLSDLAAVGATPTGILLSATLPDESWQAGIAEGARAACAALGTFVLGGDTNFGPPSITCCALGRIKGKPLTRKGAKPGDLLFASGRMGQGASLAAAALFGTPLFSEKQFRPIPRIQKASLLAPHASLCMDTSDGLISTLDQLMRLNGIGFEVDLPLADLLEPVSLQIARSMGIPAITMLAAIHGEFELVFTVPPEHTAAFEAISSNFIRLGTVTSEKILRFGEKSIDSAKSAKIRNLLDEAGGEPQRYFAALLENLRAFE
ncbi:MAG TPA: AIR synthase related protein [Chroococcales cyanobacterium]|jgi:thiamine-monophosphate kinase